MKKAIGIYLVIISLFVTLSLWLVSKENLTVIPDNPLKSASQITALWAAILLAWEFMLATRLKIIERLFGGLDKVYKLHHIIGGLSYILILIHPLLLVLRALPDAKLASIYLLPSSSLSYTMGILALYLFSLLLIITFYVRVPYNIWKQTHNYMGLPLLLTMFHVMLISSDVSNYLPLKIWILSFLIVGLVAFLYKRFFYHLLASKFDYEIENILLKNGILEITMSAIKKQLDFRPGQFVFTKFKNPRIGSELHPFSISSSPESEVLRLSIKLNGDFTKKLVNLKVGERVVLYGPHGAFLEKYLVKKKDAIFIAGGIGVTPFLSLINSQALKKQNVKNWLYYCAPTDTDTAYHKEITALTANNPNLFYKQHISTKHQRITAKLVMNDVEDLKDKMIFLCGPTSMMHHLAEQFIELGVKRHNILFEEFDFLS